MSTSLVTETKAAEIIERGTGFSIEWLCNRGELTIGRNGVIWIVQCYSCRAPGATLKQALSVAIKFSLEQDDIQRAFREAAQKRLAETGIEDQIIDGLEKFSDDLESGKIDLP